VQVRAEAAELEELRELKKDIERKEKQQAAIIENQVRSTCLLIAHPVEPMLGTCATCATQT
jgi:hypothetical protein